MVSKERLCFYYGIKYSEIDSILSRIEKGNSVEIGTENLKELRKATNFVEEFFYSYDILFQNKHDNMPFKYDFEYLKKRIENIYKTINNYIDEYI